MFEAIAKLFENVPITLAEFLILLVVVGTLFYQDTQNDKEFTKIHTKLDYIEEVYAEEVADNKTEHQEFLETIGDIQQSFADMKVITDYYDDSIYEGGKDVMLSIERGDINITDPEDPQHIRFKPALRTNLEQACNFEPARVRLYEEFDEAPIYCRVVD